MDRTTTDFGPNEWLLREMYFRYLEDPSSVSEAWREFFEDYDGPERRPILAPGEAGRRPAPRLSSDVEKQIRVVQLINMYRVRGHLIADLDPLSSEPRALIEELDPRTYGLTEEDLDREFLTGDLAGEKVLPL